MGITLTPKSSMYLAANVSFAPVVTVTRPLYYIGYISFAYSSFSNLKPNVFVKLNSYSSHIFLSVLISELSTAIKFSEFDWKYCWYFDYKVTSSFLFIM